MKIIVSIEPVKQELLSLENLASFPTLGLMWEFWKSGDFGEFLESNGFKVPQNFASVFEVCEFAKTAFDKFKKVLKKHSTNSGFDENLVKAFAVSREFSDEFELAKFDISALDVALQEALKKQFLDVKSRSFVDFKTTQDGVLLLAYTRSCIGENEDGTLSVVQSKKGRVTLSQNNKAARHGNPVVSHMVAMLALVAPESVEWCNFYAGSDGGVGQVNLNTTQILAKKELKKEASKTRTSLPEDSFSQVVSKEVSQVRLDVNLPNSSEKSNSEEENLVASAFENFSNLELEKTRQRLQDAQKNADAAFADVLENLRQGVGVADALNYIKQKYRNDYTVSYVDIKLTARLASITRLETRVGELENELKTLEESSQKEFERLKNEVAKREKTVAEFQATCTRKSNELIRLKEFHEQEISTLKRETQKQLDEIQSSFDEKLADFKALVEAQDELTERLNLELEMVKKDRDKWSECAMTSERKNAVLTSELEKLRK